VHDNQVAIAVVMACFNRRETTLRCLRSLLQQASAEVRIAVHLTDDASPDGTGRAVREAFPQVTVLEGDGERFWGGGMHIAMQSAMKTEFDFMLWLNDDVTLKPNAIERLLSAYRETSTLIHLPVIVGATENPDTGAMSYGGFKRRNRWQPSQLDRIEPDSTEVRHCDTLNGNCVLVPAEVVERVGLIDPIFVHQLGDIDYGYRVASAGGTVLLAPGFIGACAPNIGPPAWRARPMGLRAKLKILASPRGLPAKPWLTFMWRHGGPIALIALLASYAKALTARAVKTETPRVASSPV
jgi:GT2 family glycosyltransferase